MTDKPAAPFPPCPTVYDVALNTRRYVTQREVDYLMKIHKELEALKLLDTAQRELHNKLFNPTSNY